MIYHYIFGLNITIFTKFFYTSYKLVSQLNKLNLLYLENVEKRILLKSQLK